jgi:hypothetical protein
MNRYSVLKGPATFGPGQIIGLSLAQIAAREHNVKVLDTKKAKPGALIKVEVRNSIEFKTGEVVGLEEFERRLEGVLSAIDAKPVEAVEDKPADPV